MTTIVLASAPCQLASLFFLLLAALGTELGARATIDCTSGFISLDRLAALATKTLVNGTTTNRQMVFPNINFTCNGVITELTLLARRHTDYDRTLNPEFQVWRRNNADGVYTRVGGTALSEELSDNQDGIYQHTVDSCLEFQAGDVFGIFQPEDGASRLRVVFQRNSGPQSLYVSTHDEAEPPSDSYSFTDVFTDYPLVVISADPQECVRGSASLETVQAVRDHLNGVNLHSLVGHQSVSPQIKFICNGNITKWIVGGYWDSSKTFFPELQVWRRANESIPNNYHRVGSTVINVAMENNDSLVYEYPVDPPLPVEVGDVLGIYQPLRSVSRLKVLYESYSGPVTLYQTLHNMEDFPGPAGVKVQSHSSLPLVTVGLVPKPTVVMSSSTKSTIFSASPMISTCSAGGGVDMPASFPATAVGTGVAVGVVVAIAILAAVMIVIYTHKKRNYSLKDSTNTGIRNAEEMKSSETCVKSPSISSIVKNEAYGTAESAQPIKIHGNDAYQTAAEAIATEQNEAYSGRVEGIDHTHSTTVEYEEISALHAQDVEVFPKSPMIS